MKYISTIEIILKFLRVMSNAFLELFTNCFHEIHPLEITAHTVSNPQ